MDDATFDDASTPDRPFAGARRLRAAPSRVESWADLHAAVQDIAEGQALARPAEGAWRPRGKMPTAALFTL